MKKITKLQKPLNGKGWFYELNNTLRYGTGNEMKRWYNALSLRRKITLRNSGEIELPF